MAAGGDPGLAIGHDIVADAHGIEELWNSLGCRTPVRVCRPGHDRLRRPRDL